jgi:Rhodopirellula transposase DDE domain
MPGAIGCGKEPSTSAPRRAGGLDVRHVPPGPRQGQKIEHRLCCHMTEPWRGRPWISHEVVVNFLGHPTTNTGLTMQAELDKHTYPTGIQVSQEDMKRRHLLPAQFHGKDWNSALKPHEQRQKKRPVI